MLLQDANHKPKSNGWYNLNLNGWIGWRVRLVVILHWLCSCCFMIGSFESGQCGDWCLIGCCKAPLNFPIYQTRYMVNTQLLASLFQPVFGASFLLLSSSLKSLPLPYFCTNLKCAPMVDWWTFEMSWSVRIRTVRTTSVPNPYGQSLSLHTCPNTLLSPSWTWPYLCTTIRSLLDTKRHSWSLIDNP